MAQDNFWVGQCATAQANVFAVAGVFPGLWGRYQTSVDGVQVNVGGDAKEILFGLDEPGLKWSLKQGSNALTLPVDGFGVRDGEGLYDRLAEVVGIKMNQEVVMVGHEAIGDYSCMGRMEILAEPGEEEGPVFGQEEDGLSVHAAVVEVVMGFTPQNGHQVKEHI